MLHATSMHNLYGFRYTIAPWGCKDHILRGRSQKIKENQNLKNFLGALSPPGCAEFLTGCRKTGRARAGDRGICGPRRMWTHLVLLGPGEGFPDFPPPLREKAGPLSILSMPRLCAFAEQTTLPTAFAASPSSLSGLHPVPRKGPATSSHLP
jgi:hypothetical protein